jgi:hypothetical protein
MNQKLRVDLSNYISSGVMRAPSRERILDVMSCKFFGITHEEIERKNMKYSEVLALQLKEALEEEQRILSKFGEEPPDGSVIKFKVVYDKGGHGYTWAAVRVGKFWYTTAFYPENRKLTWDALTKFLDSKYKIKGFKVCHVGK